MYYVYLIRSLEDRMQCYVGVTTNLKTRFSEHNAGKSIHTNKYKPWELEVYIAFKYKAKALEFEKYLKHGSGHAFSKKHFWSAELNLIAKEIIL